MIFIIKIIMKKIIINKKTKPVLNRKKKIEILNEEDEINK
jgi:hypothetical protein